MQSGMLCKETNCQREKPVRILILISVLVWLVQLPVRASQSVTLNWDSQGGAAVVGYKIYYGTTSHNYTQMLVVSNITSTTISELACNTTYYFVATAFDDNGNESDFSNETSFVATSETMTVAATMTSTTISSGQFGFTVSGVLGRTYVVQASTDLVNWDSVQTNTSPFTFTDLNTASYSHRFYRTFTATP